MKDNIHPNWHQQAKVICACGNSFTTGSTVSEIHTEICSQCHPFFTGKEKLIDTEGLVEKFEKKRAFAQKKLGESKTSEQSKKDSREQKYQPKSLKEMLEYASKTK